MRIIRVGRGVALIVALAVVIPCSAGVATAKNQASATGWEWAAASRYWDNEGTPIVPQLVADPTGRRQGLVMKVDFATWGWSFACTDGEDLYHFEHGRDYTLVFDVYSGCPYKCEMDVRVIPAPLGKYSASVDRADACVSVVGDGEWHRVPVSITDFAGAGGDYYLWFHDQAGEGCWLIGDIRVTGGTGHSAK
ncbi:MAG: hypothetical protein FDZ70_00395 [Actinobacteria bacterium]|nr:MAG: hypothetical protein FDZ70_00395 [Actinomycetota bacterium]